MVHGRRGSLSQWGRVLESRVGVTRTDTRCRHLGVSVAADSLELAYRRHAAQLIRYATVLVGPDDAHDVVTDAMVHVFASNADVSQIDNVEAYLFRAVHHRAVDHHRATSRRRRREMAYARERTHPSADWTPVDARASLEPLTVQQRTIVFLTYWADQTPAAIADVLGVSEGTVRKQLARARERLREATDDRPT
jgi:RNA polymerase sigma factor (sigma-70 family)